MEATSITQKFVRKPLYVDAVQVTEENFSEIVRWCFGEIGNIDDSPVDKVALASDGPQPSKQYIHVRVHNPKNPRQTRAFVGDWILYTDRGYKVYTTKAFQANFDLVPEPQITGFASDPVEKEA
jgi:hypothetical protein